MRAMRVLTVMLAAALGVALLGCTEPAGPRGGGAAARDSLPVAALPTAPAAAAKAKDNYAVAW